jgi:hypothetical protein
VSVSIGFDDTLTARCRSVHPSASEPVEAFGRDGARFPSMAKNGRVEDRWRHWDDGVYELPLETVAESREASCTNRNRLTSPARS